jgi:hypothetical protein
MLATTLLVMVIGVVVMLLGAVALVGRETIRARATGSGRAADTGWMFVASGDNGSDCSAGDGGCDGGGDGGGGD